MPVLYEQYNNMWKWVHTNFLWNYIITPKKYIYEIIKEKSYFQYLKIATSLRLTLNSLQRIEKGKKRFNNICICESMIIENNGCLLNFINFLYPNYGFSFKQRCVVERKIDSTQPYIKAKMELFHIIFSVFSSVVILLVQQ